MALLQVGIALGVYTGMRVVERVRRPQRFARRLRAGGVPKLQPCSTVGDTATALKRRRTDLQASNWALVLCLGSYALPILTPAALALTVYSMLPLLRASEQAVLSEGHLGNDLVNASVCVGSIALGHPLGAAMQCWVFDAADVAVLKSRERARRLLDAGLPLPAPARVLRDDGETRIAVEALRPGDVVLLATGEPVPVDGHITVGSLSVDQQQLTGEAVPQALGPGDPIYAGSLVLRGEARLEVAVAGRDTALARVERLLRTSVGHSTQQQLKAEAVADAAALPLLGASATLWPLIGPSAAVALLFGAPINAVRAAGALTISDQLATLLTHGILVKDGRALEVLADVDTVLFDKTGTLTANELSVTEVTTTGDWAPAHVLAVAAAAEGRIAHPLAQALVMAAAQTPDGSSLQAHDLDFRVGFGVTARIDGQRVLVGGRRHLDAAGIAINASAQRALDTTERQGGTALLVADAASVQGVISLQTLPRPEAADIMHFLAEHGITRIELVSGDAEQPTRVLARGLGIDHVHSNVLPEDKAALVRRLQAEGRHVCFIGDGVNDALAMRAADCAISLRGGATLAADTAGILLLDGDLRRLPLLLTTARTQQGQLHRVLTYWGSYAVLNAGLTLGLRLGVLPSSLLFGAAFGVGLVAVRLPR